MNIEILEVQYEQKSILQHLLELYHYDFSEIDGDELNEFGLYGYKYLDLYWIEEKRIPLFMDFHYDNWGNVYDIESA